MAVRVGCRRNGGGGGSSSLLLPASPRPLSPVRLDRWGILGASRVRVEGLPRGVISACDSGGLEGSLPASSGVFQIYLWGVGLGRHEDPVCPMEDPPLGVRFEDVDGGMLAACVEAVPRCDGYFRSGGVEV